MWYLLITFFVVIAVILGISDGEEHLKTLLQALLVIIAGCLLISWIAKFTYIDMWGAVVILSLVVIIVLWWLIESCTEIPSPFSIVILLSFLALGTGTFFASRQYYAYADDGYYGLEMEYEQRTKEQEQKYSDQIDSILKNKKEIETMTIQLLCDQQHALDGMNKSTLDDMQRTYNVGRKRISENFDILDSIRKNPSSDIHSWYIYYKIDRQIDSLEDSLSILLDALIHPDTLAVPETPVEDEDYPIGPDEKRAYGDDAVYTPAQRNTTDDTDNTEEPGILD